MKFNMKDGKTVLLILVALAIFGALMYFGDDWPGVKQIREGYTD